MNKRCSAIGQQYSFSVTRYKNQFFHSLQSWKRAVYVEMKCIFKTLFLYESMSVKLKTILSQLTYVSRIKNFSELEKRGKSSILIYEHMITNNCLAQSKNTGK